MLLHHDERWVKVTPVLTEDGRRRGTLYLTNLRLVLEVDASDRMLDRLSGATRPQTAFEAIPGEVRNAHLVRRLFGTPVLQVELRGQQYFLITPEAPEWVDLLARHRAAPPPPPPPLPPPPPPPPPPAPHVIQTIERQVVKVRCRHCGQLSDETLVRCPSCGAPH